RVGSRGRPGRSQASKSGRADPRPPAPTPTPSAVPRRSRNQPAAIFIPGGYTQASAAPVQNRSPMMAPAEGATAIAALQQAPNRQPPAKSRLALTASARFVTTVTTVPNTNAARTGIVSHARAPASSAKSREMAGAAAVAENQSVMPRTSPAATHASIRAGTDIGGEL